MRPIAISLILVAGCGRLGFDGTTGGAGGGGAGSGGSGLPNNPNDPGTLNSGLVAQISFDGSLTDDVSSGDAECSGAECPTFAPGVGGEAAVFDGAATCVHLPWLTSWTPSTYTIAAWVNPTSMSAPIVVREHDTSCPSPSLESSDSAVGFVGTTAASTHQMAWTNTSMLSTGDWTHVAIAFDGTNQRVYVGGTCQCQVQPAIALAYTTYEVTIGCYPAAGTWYTGAISDVRIYDRVLDSAELVALASENGSTPTAADCTAACDVNQP